MWAEQPLTKALEKAQKERRRKEREARKKSKSPYTSCYECQKNRGK